MKHAIRSLYCHSDDDRRNHRALPATPVTNKVCSPPFWRAMLMWMDKKSKYPGKATMGDLYADDITSESRDPATTLLHDIRSLIACGQREGPLLDYKADVSPKDNWPETIAAFANTFGGLIIFGVEGQTDQPRRLTEYDPKGVEMKTRLGSTILSRIQPRPDITIRVVNLDTDPSKEVAVVRVSEGAHPPYMHSKGDGVGVPTIPPELYSKLIGAAKASLDKISASEYVVQYRAGEKGILIIDFYSDDDSRGQMPDLSSLRFLDETKAHSVYQELLTEDGRVSDDEIADLLHKYHAPGAVRNPLLQ